MSANPPGRGDENEWDANDRSGSQWSTPQAPPSNNGWGVPQSGQQPVQPPHQPVQPPHQQGQSSQPPSRPYVHAPHPQSGPPHQQGQRPNQQNPRHYPQGQQPNPQSGPPNQQAYRQNPQAYQQAQYSSPQTGSQPQQGGPTYQQATAAPPKKRGGLIALFAVVVIVLGVGIGWGAATLFSRNSDDNAAVAPTDEPKNGQTDSGDDSAAASEDPEPTETESKLPDDPKKALKQLAETDGKQVTDDLDGKWVPQLSSKKVGIEAEGKKWKEQDILDEHEELREEYPRVRLVWSGDFNSFKESDFWVTVVGIGYDDPEDALSWCSSHGLGPDNCYAKQLNTSRGYEGTTRLQD